MKKTILKQNRRGFTLAELLAVILILVILIGLGVPGFIALRKNIKIAEYDDIAREIYLAAQNQLTRLSANGMDKEIADKLSDDSWTVPYTDAPSDYDTASGGAWAQDDYRYTNQGDERTDLLLPLGTIADSVRSNGFYTIEYNPATNTVYGVFYAEKGFNYNKVSDASQMKDFRLSRDVRKDPMVGYYGGSAVRQNPQNYCETPQLEIINENELRLNIKNVPTDIVQDGIGVSISDGEHTITVQKEAIKQIVSDNGYTVLLDSILVPNSHFCQLFPGLTPGKDLNITVTFRKDGALSSSASISTNSLFATREGTNGETVTIAWARHLQNLESSVSGLNDPAITIARQTDHIRWEKNVFAERNFVSIENHNANEGLLFYEGNNLEIRDLSGENGLFAQTKENMALSGIRLVNPDIDALASNTDPVGALVGTAKNGTQIVSCGVYYSKAKPDKTVNYGAYRNCGIANASHTATGGLIGKATGTTVNYSFAALPDITGSGAALIGDASGCRIKYSYANCDDLPTSNFLYFIGGTGNTVDNCYAVGNVENDTPGAFAEAANDVSNSYYAVSHRKFAADPKNNEDLYATEFCYKVSADTAWVADDYNGMVNATKTGGWANHEEDWKNLFASVTHPYREYLDGKAYPYPAIAHPSLGAMDHYGSWPDGDATVDLTITMALLNNEDAGYAIFAGHVIVTNLDDIGADGNPVVLFDSELHKTDSGEFDGNDTVSVDLGTHIRITVEEKEGYQYSNTDISGSIDYSNHVEYTVRKNTEAVITFRQLAFQLTGIPAIDVNTYEIDGADYLVDISSSMKTVVVQGSNLTESAETGATITVRPNVPANYIASVVWYCPEGQNADESKRVYLTQEESGNYTFQMPSGDTEIHVMYTKEEAYFKIQYFLMDTEGNYTEKPVQVVNPYKCGLGSQINQSMIDAMAESSGLPLTLDGQRVRYLNEAKVTTVDGRVIFDSVRNAEGQITKEGIPYISKKSDFPEGIAEEERLYTVSIYIARKEYRVTLTADTHITGVRFAATEGQPEEYQKTVTRTYRYGATVSAEAQVVPGYGFSYWNPQDSRFLMSGDTQYTFQVPAFDLNLHAVAAQDRYLVTVNLLENGESWLYSSASRKANPIKLTLVNSREPSKTYPMQVMTEDTISYAMQAVVPAVTDYEEGYYIRVDYESGDPTWIYANGAAEGTNENNEKLLLYVRDKSVETTAEFFSVTYFPNKQYTRGTVPKGGVYPKYFHVKVAGNTGLLRNDTDDDKIFTGWKDRYAGDTSGSPLYSGGEDLMLIRQTDMFAQWKKNLDVTYHYGKADGGELPVDNGKYQVGATVTIQRGSLTRKGYLFQGWSRVEGSDVVQFTGNGDTYQFGNTPLNLYPVWALEDYTIQFLDTDGTLLQEVSRKHYGDTIDAPDIKDNEGKSTILGWSLSVGGDVLYRPGETITVTGKQTFFARPTVVPVVVTYKSSDGSVEYSTESFGKGIPGYLNYVPNGKPVTAWSTEKDGKGTLYLCREDGRSEKAYAFMEDTTLYAVTGKVYNYNKQLWFDTLYAAVRNESTVSGDTLIVYRNTDEPHNIWFNKSLYVIASGNRRVTWIDGATADDGTTLKSQTSGEFVGCMNVDRVKVFFGRSNVPTLSMDGSTLTFDANKQSRVISLGNTRGSESIFHMYDGVTLTNGERDSNKGTNGRDDPDSRTGYGGGVYAGAGATFYMHGGTISYCKAVSGGGVYLLMGSRMYMGDMVSPEAYSATATYYRQAKDEVLNETIYINASDVTVENYKQFYITAGNPRICYNESTQSSGKDGGGGLLMLDLDNGDLILYRGSITNNKTSGNGGGILTDSGPHNNPVANKAKLRIYEVDVSHNTSDGNGGGIFQWQGTVYVYNSTIRQNQAKNGGGVYLIPGKDETCNVEFYFGDISDNKATGNGGGVCGIGAAGFILDGGNLCRNTAANGGGTYMEAGSTITFKSGTVAENTATGDGGGFYSDGTVNMTGGTLSGNSAISWGGGVCVNDKGSMTMTGGTICNNSSEKLGGGIMVKNTLFLGGGRFYGNTDKEEGSSWHGRFLDEDYVNPSPNDIYLRGDKVIIIPEGGIDITGEERIEVDFERDYSMWTETQQGTLPYRFAEYVNEADYEPKDALLFTYYGTRSSEYSIKENQKPDLTVVTHEDLNPDLDQTAQKPVGLYFAEKNEGDGITSFVNFDFNFPGCVNPEGTKYNVGSVLNLDDTNVVSVPERPGYYLAGWARTPDALEEEYELYYDVVENVWRSVYESDSGWTVEKQVPEYTVKDYFSQTLYAMWRPCVVVYDLGADAIANGVKIKSTSVGPKVTLLNPDPPEYKVDEQSFRFLHWVHYIGENQTDGNEYVPTQQLELTENLRLTAVWEERTANSFIITLYFNGGTSDVNGEVRRREGVTSGDSYKLPDATQIHRSGKDLLGWASTEDATAPEYAPGRTISNVIADMTLYAVWVDVFDVTYDVNFEGGGGNRVFQVRKGEYATIPSDGVPTREGYQFLGWADTADAKEAKYHAGDSVGPIEEPRTLYAVWEEYTLTFDCSGGTLQDQAIYTVTSPKVDNYDLTVPNLIPTREGATFLGWALEQNATVPLSSVTVDKDMTLYAVWEVTVTFDGSGIDYPEKKVETVVVGQSLVLPSGNDGSPALLGWSKMQEAETADYECGQEFTPDKDITLYAVWESEASTQSASSTEDPPSDGDPTPSETESPTVPETEAATVPETTQPETEATQPETEATQPETEATQPETEATQPETEATQPVTEATQPETEATQPETEATQPETEATQPETEATQPETEATQPETEATQPETEATQPETEATQPETEATQPETEATQPETEATQPETEDVQPEMEADVSDPESDTSEPQTWEVIFFLEGGEWTEDPMLNDEPLELLLWDEEEKLFTYTVPVGEDVTILPPVLVREGYVLDGWMWMDEEEPDPDNWVIYPANEELPITGNMKWIPVWTEEEPPTEPAPEPQASPAPEPPTTP